MPVLRPYDLNEERVEAIRKAHDDAGLKRAQLDLSGGIDSAVMAGLLVQAVGPENLTLVHSGMNTNPEQTARARVLADVLHVPLCVLDLTVLFDGLLSKAYDSIERAWGPEVLDGMVKPLSISDRTVLGSIRSTLRAPVGRAFNRLMGGGIRHGTGNECEDRFLRFYQKGGDGEVDSNPIAMLSKAEVYQLAVCLGDVLNAKAQYRAIIEAVPSPDLWGNGDGHSDEEELLAWTGVPFTYGRVNPDTGEYTRVGTIERVSRFLDFTVTMPSGRQRGGESLLFGKFEPETGWDFMVSAALSSGCFEPETNRDQVGALLQGARRVERQTCHKLNPNIPTYGDRASLVADGILTNNLPAL